MDSEDSRSGPADNGSSSSSSSRSDSPRSPPSPSTSPRWDSGPASPPPLRDSGPASPVSVNGPESPENPKAPSEKSGKNSEVNSPNPYWRPDSPAEKRDFKDSAPCSPNEKNSDSGDDSSSPRRPRTPLSPSLAPAPSPPRSPDSAPRSPDSETNQTSQSKWSTKSDFGSRQPSVSPVGSAKSDGSSRHSSQKARRRDRSDSSRSSRESSPRERPPAKDPPTEEISEGEMESDHDSHKVQKEELLDQEKGSSREKKLSESNVNISHEDLSDVSDLESLGHASDEERKTVRKSPVRAPEQSDSRESPCATESKVNGNVLSKAPSISSPPKANSNGTADAPKLNKIPQEKTSKTEDVEEQLDFEAEEGECVETPVPKHNNTDKNSETVNNKDEEEGGASSLEEGEVSDEEERRPEETEPRPVCRFYSRGQCTWGVSCRFLHPGVTDKGNYTMFDMVRAMPPGYGPLGGHPVHSAHPAMLHSSHTTPAASRESAWERGLRTAKEMMRKATKRKEQDSDFEEKKMHLSLAGSGRGGSLGPEEEDPELAAYAGYPPASPPPISTHHPAMLKRERERDREEYYRQAEREEYYRLMERRPVYEDMPRGYPVRERSHASRYSRVEPVAEGSSPPYYQEKGPPDAHGHHKALEERPQPMPGPHKPRRGRTTREVIVQRVPGASRADDWADPWMRGGSGRGRTAAAGGEKRRRGKYSSASSYSSSSSRSSNSSPRSGSAGRHASRRGAKSPPRQRLPRAALSPSVIVQERRAATARALAMNPPAPSPRKRAPSPAAARQHAANPPPPPKGVDAFGRTKPTKPRPRKRYSKSSSSGSDSSSSSSDSDSDSHSSSSSVSSGPGRGGAAGPGGRTTAPAAPGVRQPRQDGKPLPSAQKKEVDGKDPTLAKKRGATSPVNNMVPAKKPVSRREELLKQLKAVEDAIARKRSKI